MYLYLFQIFYSFSKPELSSFLILIDECLLGENLSLISVLFAKFRVIYLLNVLDNFSDFYLTNSSGLGVLKLKSYLVFNSIWRVVAAPDCIY